MTQPTQRRKAVFLDRDGTLNATIFRDGKPRAPDHVDDFRFLPGVEEAVRRLHDAGFVLVVVTNQPDVARGWQTRDRVEAMNERVREALRIEHIRVCYHVDEDGCACRKPLPGMLLEAAEELAIDLAASFMIGDRAGDIEAGHAAGCRSVLVGDAPGEAAKAPAHALRVQSLSDAVDWILSL